MKRKDRIHLQVSDSSDDEDLVAYLILPDHPGVVANISKKTVRIRDVIGDYKGPDLFIDFDSDGALIGVEIID